MNCSFEECNRTAKVKGLCHGHYNQQHRGKPLAPIGPYKKYLAPAPGRKICTRCERVLVADRDFYDRSSGTKQSVCKDCMKETAKARREKAKEASH